MRSEVGKQKGRYLGAAVFFALVVGLLAVGIPRIGSSQESPPKPDQPGSKSGTTSIKVDVDLVLVNATVTDINNRFVTGLEKEHFQVFEDKVQQQISHFSNEDVPTSIGLLFDVSSSMTDKIARSRDAAVAFLKTSNPEDEFLLMTFADRPKIDEEFTTDVNEVQNRLIYKNAKGCTTL